MARVPLFILPAIQHTVAPDQALWVFVRLGSRSVNQCLHRTAAGAGGMLRSQAGTEFAMPLEAKVRQTLDRALNRVEEHPAIGSRLADDARRLLGRIERFQKMELVSTEIDDTALELACYALQLPLRQPPRPAAGGKPARTTLRDRAEQAAELLLLMLEKQVHPSVLAKVTQILHDLPQRTPALDETRLLADALNLEDFGVSGILLQAIQLSRQGSGVSSVAEGCEKRDLYGYWEARLKDGFHFDPVRRIAAARVDNARKAAALLVAELREDQALS